MSRRVRIIRANIDKCISAMAIAGKRLDKGEIAQAHMLLCNATAYLNKARVACHKPKV